MAEHVYADAAVGGQVDRVTRLFGSRTYCRLWISQVVSSLGDWIGLIAVTAIAARVGGGDSGTAVGLVLSARVVPGLFLGSFMGVLADRMDRKRTMVCCDVGRAIVLACLPFVKDIPTLFLASLLLELFTLLWSSAKEASVPNLVDRSFLPTANSLSLAAAYGTFPVSSAVFAVLSRATHSFGTTFGLHSLGPETLALWFDVLTFLVSASTIATLSMPRRTVMATGERKIDLGRAFRDIGEGFQFIKGNPAVQAVLIGLACGVGGGGTVVPLGPVFSDVVLHAGSSGFGVLLTAFGVGVAGGVIGVGLIQKHLPPGRLFLVSVFAGGAFLIAAASMSTLVFASLFIGGFGICTGSAYVVGFSMLQSEVDDDLRGRTFATLYTSSRLCLFLALVVAPFLSTFIDDASRSLFNSKIRLLGLTVHLPGARLTLWLGGLIILGSGLLVRRGLRAAALTAPAEPEMAQE